MTFDNSKTIISIRIKLFAVTVVFLAFIVLTYIAKMIKFPLLGMSETTWTLILAGLYLMYAFFPMYLNYQYIYFSDEGENIIVRYFTAGIVGGKKNSIQISKKTFSGFKVTKKLGGLIQSVTLFQKFREGIAKYPPVFISALTKEERAKILRSLNQQISNE
jgi:ribonucleotide reductase alpha subunit